MSESTLSISRRTFLTAAATVPLLAAPVVTLAASFEQRSVSFVHTHTGEQLTTTYFRAGQYDPTSLTRVNHLLRDFRSSEIAAMDPGLLDILFDLKVMANRDSTFEIISAFRSPTTNARLRAKSGGVAEKSLHMQARALDIRLTGFSTQKLKQLAMSLGRGGVGFYSASNFIHVDTGRVRYW